MGYASRLIARDKPVRGTMRELATRYPRYGYRRIRIILARAGHRMSVGRAHRLWRSEKLQVPRKRPRRRVASSRPRQRRQQDTHQVRADERRQDTDAHLSTERIHADDAVVASENDIADVLDRLDKTADEDLADLLPDRWKPQSAASVATIFDA